MESFIILPQSAVSLSLPTNMIHWKYSKIAAGYQTQMTLNHWWRHQMETFSALLALCSGSSPVSGDFPVQRPVTRSFDVFFDLHLIKLLSRLVIWDAIAPIMTSP